MVEPGDRTRDLMISSQRLRPLDHEAGQPLEVKCTILYQIFNNILYTDIIYIRIIRCHILTLYGLFWCKQERFYYLHFSKHRSHFCVYVFAKHRSTEIHTHTHTNTHTHTLRERTCNVYKYEQKKRTDIEGSILKL